MIVILIMIWSSVIVGVVDMLFERMLGLLRFVHERRDFSVGDDI